LPSPNGFVWRFLLLLLAALRTSIFVFFLWHVGHKAW